MLKKRRELPFLSSGAIVFAVITILLVVTGEITPEKVDAKVFNLVSYLKHLTGKLITSDLHSPTAETTLATDSEPLGIIVELKEKPIIERLYGKNENAPAVSGMAVAQQPQGILEEYKAKHRAIKAKIIKKLDPESPLSQVTGLAVGDGDSQGNDVEQRFLGEYYYTFNGFAINITEEQGKELLDLSEIASIYPNSQFKALLSDSVPLVGADKVWELDAEGNNCHWSGKNCLTGKGVTIGIIDTGVDYAHPDLGQSTIVREERPYQKIGEDRDITSESGIIQKISLDNGRIAYIDSGKIKIYTFATGEIIETVSVDYPTEYFLYLVLRGDYLLYQKSVEGGDKFPLILYNLVSKEKKIIAEYLNGGRLSFDGGKIVFGLRDAEDKGIKMYDINTGQTTSIAPDIPSNYFPHAFISGNIIVYLNLSNIFDRILVIYDIGTGEKREVDVPEADKIVDFKGSEILYAETDPNDDFVLTGDYFLYNIETGSKIKLHHEDPLPPVVRMKHVDKPVQGRIGDEIIVFSEMVDLTYGVNLRIHIYDRILDRYVVLNLFDKVHSLDVEGRKICYTHKRVTGDPVSVHCHDYDPASPYTIPDVAFNEKVVGGYDFANKEDDPMDDHGHGTHVAAIAAGNGDLKGVAPGASIFAYKVLSSGGYGYESDIIGAIERSIDPNQDGDTSDHLDIISLSLGSYCIGGYYTYDCGPDDPLSKAVDNAVRGGIVAVVAAGNMGYAQWPRISITSPGTARKAITVGAIGKSKSMVYFSSYGPVEGMYLLPGPLKSSYSQFVYLKPDVVAPGVEICAAEWDSWLDSLRCLDDKHISISGTSMATPHVSGAIAIILQKFPTWTPEELKAALLSKTTDIGSDILHKGYGLVNIPSVISFRGFPAIAHIETEGEVRGIIDIKGTAKARSFKEYSLSYGVGANPTEWIEITKGTSPIENGILFSGFDSSKLGDDLSFLRLVAVNAEGEQSEYMSILYYQNDAIDYNRAAAICSQSPCIVDESRIGSRGLITKKAEPNQPNTVQKSCKDGQFGKYMKTGGSIESIAISDKSGGQSFEPGRGVDVTVTAYCTGPYSYVNLVYKSPRGTWTVESSQRCTKYSTLESFSFSINLAQENGYHIIRAAYLYNYWLLDPDKVICSKWLFDDNDDVVLLAGAPPAPECQLEAQPNKILPGDTVLLTMKTFWDVDSATLDGTPINTTGGGKTVSPQQTTTYTGAVTGEGGSGTCEATVEVIPHSCSDSDGGKDHFTQGIVQNPLKSFADTCITADNTLLSVKEYFCDGNIVGSEDYQCAYGCETSSDGIALGKCNQEISLAEPLQCNDSDSGEDYFTKGTVSAGSSSRTDFCFGGSKTLYEWFCKDNKFAFATSSCSAGCIDGACDIPCTDSDNGDLFLKGESNFKGITSPDACKDSNTVIEQSCAKDASGRYIQFSWESLCPNGCADGACKLTCNEDDGGKNPWVKGIVIANNISIKDRCKNSETLIENSCIIDGYGRPSKSREEVYCYNGCQNGSCNPVTCSDSDGKDSFNRGTVVANGASYDDSCVYGDTVLEGYCETDAFGMPIWGEEQIICEHGCVYGACLHKCEDSDGNDFHIEGKAKRGNIEIIDYCQDGNLKEGTCVQNELVEEAFECPFGCSRREDGKEAGKCNSGEFITKCIDSDNVEDYYLAGKTTAYEGKKAVYTTKDKCFSEGGKQMLKERVCNGVSFIGITHVCPNGCENGACVPYCSDTDGYSPYMAGRATYNERISEDACKGKKVIEQTCIIGEGGVPALKAVSVTCGNGCSNGACNTYCIDKDGENSKKASYVEYNGGKFSDICKDGKVLIERTCGKDAENQPIAEDIEINCLSKCSKGKCA